MMEPVVIIHWGDDEYMTLAARQAAKYAHLVVTIRNREQKYGSMEIDRWFILEKYMRENELRRVVYIDSDVLLFTDPRKDHRTCDLAFSKQHSGHTMFVNNVDALTNFCKFIDVNIDNLNLINETKQRLPNHVFANAMGDMVLLNSFYHDSDWVIDDTFQYSIDRAIYSHNYNTEPNIYTENRLPFWQNEFGIRVKMNSIHFQGAAKALMKDFANV